MAGYLDTYGVGEERREKRIKTAVLAAIAGVIVGGILFWFLKNYRQEHQVRLFLEEVAQQNYQAAYARWGCTTDKPCRDYPFPEFMKDWGPQSAKSGGTVTKSRSCGSGIIITVTYPNKSEDKLWVQRDNLVVGFSPWPGCPAR